ncbi:hypothetical protein FRC00_000466 [Tulasnella sp. 408]|nr:hypothetical protein FRC00_000466 [Tulasnella sp. 408]
MIRSKKIYILLPQRLNNEDFNDDPGTLMGLPASEKTTEFWKRYDRLADTHDGKMTEDLSDNLDVLLIFAALFSAINTAFISLTMPGLSSDPLTENNALLRLLVMKADNRTLAPADLSPPFTPSSNSVAVNCLLYASLSCSLLAAVAAMMAKEWLQSFDRTGQMGPLEEQGRFRQRKFNGVQQWHLESIIRSLPNILLLSVILFFAGVCLFLFPVNKAVAAVVIAFSGGGAILCGVAIVAGATFALCPYQSAASRALKRTGRLFSPQWWKDLARAVGDLVVQRLPKLVRRLPKLVRETLDTMHQHPTVATAIMQSTPIALLSTITDETVTPEQVEVAQAAGWLLGTTSNRADQIAAAQFICTLERTVQVFVFGDSETWRRLVFLTHEAFDTWYSRPTESNQDVAELLGLVLCRALQPFRDSAKGEDIINLPLYHSRSFGGTFLRALESASTKYPCYKSEDKKMILHMAFLDSVLNRGGVIPQYQWARVSRFFLHGNTPPLVDVLLGLWAKTFCNNDPGKSSFDRFHEIVEPADEGGKKLALARDLLNAVICGTSVLSSLRGNLQSELHAMHGYTACLRRATELSIQIPLDELTNVIDGLGEFILSYLDPLISSTSGESSLELVRLSMEAVLALHAFIDGKPCSHKIPNSRDARVEQLRIDDFINTAVHIMLVDCESLGTSKLLPRTQPRALACVRTHVLAPVEELGRECRKMMVESKAGLRPRRRGWDSRRRRQMWQEPVARALRERMPALQERMLALQERARALDGLDLDGLDLDGLDLDGLVLDGLDLDGLDRRLEGLQRRLDGLQRRLDEHALKLAKDIAQRLQVEASILRMLLWVRKQPPGTQSDHSDKCKLFNSICSLWAPLETRVDFTINGIEWGINGERLTFDDGNRNKLLTSDDLNGIVEFVEELRKDVGKLEFIRRKVDVEINRLCAHFNRRVDWDYDLYDLREQRTFCPRSRGRGLGMIL